MPFGPYEDWDACILDQTSKGHDEESAKRICGRLQADLERAKPMAKTLEAQILDTYARYSREIPIIASVPRPVEGEPILSWDLDRFLKNPVILWAHDPTCIPIGRAKDVVFDPNEGLKMVVVLASEKVSELAENVYQGIREKIIRSVSVGFDFVTEQGEVSPTPTTRARLVEVSFVPIGQDEDAGTPDLNPDAIVIELSDEEMKKQASAAARSLALHRARVLKQRASKLEECKAMPPKEKPEDCMHTDSDFVYRMDRASLLGRVKRTQIGGAEVPARVSRTGVLKYYLPDGSIRCELRLDSEVFKPESLKTLEDAPVIDIQDHTGMVTPDKWKDVSLGHTKNVRMDGQFIAADLVIQDKDTLDRIERKERTEISLGYRCRLDMTAGVYNGEPYDCIQRDIVYNHAALCPPNRGRAGPEVGLRLDNNSPTWAISHFEDGDEIMIKVRLDGKEYTEGSPEHLDALDRHYAKKLSDAQNEAKARLDAVEAKVAEEKKRADELEGKLDAKSTEIETIRTDAAAAKKKSDEAVAELRASMGDKIREKIRLVSRFMRFFGDDEEAEGEMGDGKKKERTDSIDKLVDMSEREVMLKAIRMKVPNFDDAGRSDDYIRSRFDGMIEAMPTPKGVDEIVMLHREAVKREERTDAKDAPVKIVVDKRTERDRIYADAWKGNGSAAK